MKTRVNVSFDTDFLEALDRVVDQLGTNRSVFLERAALLVMTRESRVVPPMPVAIDPGAKAFLDRKYPRG